MLDSPGGRRRRLIQAIVPNNNNNNNNNTKGRTSTVHYTSVPTLTSSSSLSSPGFSIRRRGRNISNDPRKLQQSSKSEQSFVTMGYRPVDPSAVAGHPHGYRIDVSKDGSMITAVPVDDLPMHGGGVGGANRFKAPPPRPSLLMFGQELSVSSLHSSTHELLDARGKQRNKMKLLRPTVNPLPSIHKPTKKVIHTDTELIPNNPNQTSRDKLKQTKGFLTLTKTGENNDNSTNRSQQPQSGIGSETRTLARKSKIRWDLSPKRHDRAPSSQILQPQVSRSNSSGNLDDASFTSFPILSPNHKFDDNSLSRNDLINNLGEKGPSNENFTTADNYKFDEIRNETDIEAVRALSNNDNLQQRLAEIQLQKKELAENIAKKGIIKGTLITAIDENLRRNTERMKLLDNELKEIQSYIESKSQKKSQQSYHPSSHQTIVSDDSIASIRRIQKNPSGIYDEIDDPSINADTDSVADLYRKEKSGSGRVIVSGLDPPSRLNPTLPPMIEEEAMRQYRHQHSYFPSEAKKMDRHRLTAILHVGEHDVDHADSLDVGRKISRSNDTVLLEVSPSSREESALQNDVLERIQTKQLSERPPLHYSQHSMTKRTSHVTTQSRKKFVHFNLPTEHTDVSELKFTSANSYDSPSIDIENGSNNDVLVGDDMSWGKECFDVDAYNAETGSFTSSSDRHDASPAIYKNDDGENRVQHHQYQQPNTLERKATPGSTTSLDLGFIHAVAAVVIQTTVRRFLAEIAAEERRYAVNVIQTALCKWMARLRSRGYYESSSSMFDFSKREFIPRTTTKSVKFEDEYNDFYHFAATEIQRCYRGWWARDGIEVDRFAATMIQKLFRGWWVREGIDVDRYCAVEIQRIFRGYLCRMRYFYDRYCIIVVQSVVRRYLAFYSSAVRLANILYIQAVYRGYKVRAELRRYVRTGQEVAATFIQSQWRCYDAQMNYINTLADILIVQSVIRRWLTIRKIGMKLGLKPRPTPGIIVSPGNIVSPTIRQNPHLIWQEHRLKIVNKQLSPESPGRYIHPDSLDEFNEESSGGTVWYDGNKSETSDLLRNWKGRKSK